MIVLYSDINCLFSSWFCKIFCIFGYFVGSHIGFLNFINLFRLRFLKLSTLSILHYRLGQFRFIVSFNLHHQETAIFLLLAYLQC